MRRLHILGLCAVLGLAVLFIHPFSTLQNSISDLFFSPKNVQSPITIVAIDEKSISPEGQLGRFKDWPRTYYAQALRELNKYDPAVVGIDLDFRDRSRGISAQRLQQFTDLKKSGIRSDIDWNSIIALFMQDSGAASTHPDDVELQKTLLETKRVVLIEPLFTTTATPVVVAEGSQGVLPSVNGTITPIFSGASIVSGFNNAFYDPDGVVRHFLSVLGSEKSFSYVLAQQYAQAQGKSLLETSFNDETFYRIRYLAEAGQSFNTVSFIDVVNGKVDAGLIKNHIVIIGGTAGILNDIAQTPTGSNAMPGVEILATATQQILDNFVMQESGIVWRVVSLLLLLVIAVLFLQLSLSYFAGLCIALLVVLPLAGYIAYQDGLVLDVLHPLIALIVTALIVLWYRNKTELKAKRAIKNAFAHYVSPLVVNQLAKDPSQLALGGSRQTITVLFSDIVGFTTLSEKLTPEDTVALLNDYLTAMTDVIFEFGGTLDKYQGDAIMALFGAPLADKNHAANAVQCALRMRQALVSLHDKWAAIANLPFKEELTQLDFRVGIATGPAVIGNVGSQKRFDYTAIGDIVNLGSRLESINRKYGTRIIVNKGTFTTITENSNPFACRKLDVVRVKGKSIETEIFEVVGLHDSFNADMKAMLDDFENARVMYTERNFAGAKEAFRAILERFPEDGPSSIYKNRCEFFMRKPPNIDWSPIVNLEEK